MKVEPNGTNTPEGPTPQRLHADQARNSDFAHEKGKRTSPLTTDQGQLSSSMKGAFVHSFTKRPWKLREPLVAV